MRFLTFLRIYGNKCLRPGHYIGQEWEIQSKLVAFLLELLGIYDTEVCVLACVLILLGNAQHCFINKWFLHSVFKMQGLKTLNIFKHKYISLFLLFHSFLIKKYLWSNLWGFFHKFISYIKPTDSVSYPIENSREKKKKRKPKPQ